MSSASTSQEDVAARLAALGIPPSHVLHAYLTALVAGDGPALAATFAPEGTYTNFLLRANDNIQRRQRPAETRALIARRPDLAPPPVETVPASAVADFLTTLTRDLADYRIHLRNAALSRDSRSAMVEYTMSGRWSGRLPSMVVAVYDAPLELRCIEVLEFKKSTIANTSAACSDDASPSMQVASAECLFDRYAFLQQIGLPNAKL